MWTQYAGIALTLFVLGFNAAFFIIIKFNDLVHLGKDMLEIKTDIKTILNKQEDLNLRITKQETKCTERHSRKRSLK